MPRRNQREADSKHDAVLVLGLFFDPEDGCMAILTKTWEKSVRDSR
jgi:hypothetical protein